MNINKEKFADIEDAFIRLKANDSDVSATRKIADALHSLTNKNFTIDIVKPTSKNQDCRVMSIYPEESTIDSVISAIVSEQNDSVIANAWNETMKWTIEIDSRILSKDVDMNEKELTALLLHEVGHAVYSNSIPMRLCRVVRLEYAKSNFISKQLLKDNLFSKLLSFPILNACNANISKKNMKAEIQADKYAFNSGYGKSLEDAMDKVIIYAGSADDADEDDENLMGFSIDSLNMLQKRQNALVKKNIHKMILSTPSRFVKKMVNPIITGLSGNGQTVTESVKNEYIDNRIQKITDEFYVSEFFLNRVHKLKRIDPADIDYIGLEVNDIKSNDDKMMIVSYIYNKIDTIDYYLALLDSKNPKYIIPHTRESLISMKNILEKYKNDAINRKLPEVKYGITIQYPSGYEG